MRHTCGARPYCQVNNVEVRQDAPHAINLGVVAVDLRDDEEDGAQKDGGSKAKHQWVRLNVSLLEAMDAADVVEQPVRQIVELIDEGLDGLRVVAAILDGLERRERHCELSVSLNNSVIKDFGNCQM